MIETMEQIKCTICSKSFETEKARISHDNRTHGGLGTRSQKIKWCNGCQAYRDKDDFYNLNEGKYSQCKECSGETKETWLKTTTAGSRYSKRTSTIHQRYRTLVKWAEKNRFEVNLTKEQYIRMVEYGICSYCGQPFQGIAFVDIVQPKVGLTLGNAIFCCAICDTKRKYNLK